MKEDLSRLGRDYQGKDIGIVAISANAYADDVPESLKEMAEAEAFTCTGYIDYPFKNKEGESCLENIASDMEKEEKIV